MQLVQRGEGAVNGASIANGARPVIAGFVLAAVASIVGISAFATRLVRRQQPAVPGWIQPMLIVVTFAVVLASTAWTFGLVMAPVLYMGLLAAGLSMTLMVASRGVRVICPFIGIVSALLLSFGNDLVRTGQRTYPFIAILLVGAVLALGVNLTATSTTGRRPLAARHLANINRYFGDAGGDSDPHRSMRRRSTTSFWSLFGGNRIAPSIGLSA